jgi:hypothetical protein
MHPYVLAPLLNSSTGALLKFLGDEASKRRQGRSVRAPCPLTPPPVRTNVPTLRHQGKTGRAAEQSRGGGDTAHGATHARPADSHTLRACMRVSLSLSLSPVQSLFHSQARLATPPPLDRRPRNGGSRSKSGRGRLVLGKGGRAKGATRS